MNQKRFVLFVSILGILILSNYVLFFQNTKISTRKVVGIRRDSFSKCELSLPENRDRVLVPDNFQQTCTHDNIRPILATRWVWDEGSILNGFRPINEPLVAKPGSVKLLKGKLSLFIVFDEDIQNSSAWVDEYDFVQSIFLIKPETDFSELIRSFVRNVTTEEWVLITHYQTFPYLSNILSLVKKFLSSSSPKYIGYPKNDPRIQGRFASLDAGILINLHALKLLLKETERIENSKIPLDATIGSCLATHDVSLIHVRGFYPENMDTIIQHYDDIYESGDPEKSRVRSLEEVTSEDIREPIYTLGKLNLDRKKHLQKNNNFHGHQESIPKTVHQVWVGPLPTPKAIFRCKELFENCGWKHILWTDDNIDWIISKKIFEKTKTEYNKMGDILKYEALHRYGGVYIDADSECLKTMEPLIDDTRDMGFEMFSGCENERFRPGLIASGVIGMVPYSTSSFTMLRALQFTRVEDMAWVSVGPFYFTKVIYDFQLPCYVVNSAKFYPMHYIDIKKVKKDVSEWVSYKRAAQCGSFTLQMWGTTFGYYEEID